MGEGGAVDQDYWQGMGMTRKFFGILRKSPRFESESRPLGCWSIRISFVQSLLVVFSNIHEKTDIHIGT